MKYLAILVACIALQGCYQSVNQYDISRAIGLCGELSNIVEIRAEFGGREYVQCADLQDMVSL